MPGGIEFRDLARLLSCREFAEAEGLPVRNNRLVCPFHGGENFNLQILRDGKVRCYTCGAHGDVVDLAAAVWRINKRDAAVELNERFKLGLSGESLTQTERDRREQARREARELKEMIKQAEAQAWSDACEEERAAQQAIERFTVTDADGPEFDAALRRLSAAHQRCNELQAKVRR